MEYLGPVFGIASMVLFFAAIETTRGFTYKSDLGNALAGLSIALFIVGVMLSTLL